MSFKMTCLGMMTFVCSLAFSQEIDTVSLGAGYANEVWYSLDLGIQADLPKNDWDIAFETTPQGASILINEGNGVELWLHPGDTSDWSSLIDTTGISTWAPYYNSDTSWLTGAFNANGAGHPDYGWGTYNNITHVVTGDRIFVLKMPDGSFQKIWIKDVTLGKYSFVHAPLGGLEKSHHLDAKDFSGKNFGYFSLTNHNQQDKEPESALWDLKFGQYVAMVPTAYIVTGVQTNADIKAAKAYPVNDPTTYVTYNAHTFSEHIRVIGDDWKSFNMSTFQYDIVDSTVYFVETEGANTTIGGDIWKLVFTGFGGSTDGNFIFSKTKLLEVGINKVNQIQLLEMYPNPATEVLNVVYKSTSNAQLTIRDLSGRSLYSAQLSSNSLMHSILVDDLIPGLYMVSIQAGNSMSTRKLLIQ